MGAKELPAQEPTQPSELKGKIGNRQLVRETVAARLLGMSRSTLQIWRHERKGPPYYKVGSKILYDVQQLSDWLDSRMIDPEA